MLRRGSAAIPGADAGGGAVALEVGKGGGHHRVVGVEDALVTAQGPKPRFGVSAFQHGSQEVRAHWVGAEAELTGLPTGPHARLLPGACARYGVK